MLNYVRRIPTKLYFGEGEIKHLADSLNIFGKNVLLTYMTSDGGFGLKALEVFYGN